MIRVGVAGWSYPDWEGPVYPRAKGRAFHPLAFLAPYVDAVEINASFYAVPRSEHARRWAAIAATQGDLLFTAKLHRDLTHAPWGAGSPARLGATLEALAPLAEGGRFRGWLAQFPLGFTEGAAARGHLEALSAGLAGRAWVLELRHRSWFTPGALTFLRTLGASVAHLDLPASPEHLPESAPPVGTLGYLRLHGRNAAAWFDPRAGRDQRYDHRYAPAELDGIARRAQRIAAAVEQTLVIANNHYAGKAVAAALELKARLTGAPVPAPDTLVEAYPDLRPWVVVRGQTSLF